MLDRIFGINGLTAIIFWLNILSLSHRIICHWINCTFGIRYHNDTPYIYFFANEFEKIKNHYKELKNLAIKSKPKDKYYIEYLEAVFNRAIEYFVKEINIME